MLRCLINFRIKEVIRSSRVESLCVCKVNQVFLTGQVQTLESGQFCQSSIADKMSDYEDIWNETAVVTAETPCGSLENQSCNTHPVTPFSATQDTTSRSMTPAESESQLKTYLASKLMGSGESTRLVSFEFCAIHHVMTEITLS